ncbi:MAG: hypothetical protein IH849_11980 [Acidobacteria bacterium]|nr:hypothetical protein [Acidobacteriota bacterium]
MFNLESDPNEVVDPSTLYPERLDEMMESLSNTLFSALRERSEVNGAELDPALMQSLQALGYIKRRSRR